jgi:adenine phosphoribosyltransferase
MKILKNNLNSELKLRTEQDFPVKGIEFIDITPLIIQKNVFSEITEKFYEELKDKEIDYLVLPEARGFLFGTSIANRLNVGIIPVRKKGKLSPKYVETRFDYVKEYGVDSLELPALVNDTYEGKNYYIIDDIYATGNTIKAIVEAIKKLGGNVVGAGCVINIPALNNDNDVFSLIDIEETMEQ